MIIDMMKLSGFEQLSQPTEILQQDTPCVFYQHILFLFLSKWAPLNQQGATNDLNIGHRIAVMDEIDWFVLINK